MGLKCYKERIIWQKAMDIVEEIYLITKSFPKDEIYGLASPIRRAAVSIHSNIAEGQARNSSKEFLQFLFINSSPSAARSPLTTHHCFEERL